MSLGENRDYKTADRRARTLLADHNARMDALIASGMDRDQASKQAYADMRDRSARRVSTGEYRELEKLEKDCK
jgi:hypothetical protein